MHITQKTKNISSLGLICTITDRGKKEEKKKKKRKGGQFVNGARFNVPDQNIEKKEIIERRRDTRDGME